ncbi:hypothetical protein KP509_11G025900 [Ceratopteris richardii]|uniref:Protein kinase domain-containing protein n=1 Tax=Ceratopteris richardii TaxID=49495 RepID=A0A8T2TWC7_CERRI|nr:hypothetical protein KP509_11G025900 [Ceratopteris richardii]KAH7424809.1 hypothetical protein KP509_11G025900 [Ceratopteris richardii]
MEAWGLNVLTLAITYMLHLDLDVAVALRFEQPSFNVTDDKLGISFPKQDPSWYHGQDASFQNNEIWLNPNPNEVLTRRESNIGRIIYKDPIQFTADMSFLTCFSFEIITTATFPLSGSGFAFFISASKTAPAHSTGRYLGLVSPTEENENGQFDFFAVEFDTHKSDGIDDPSGSHIGIDINSVKSYAYADSSPGSPLFPRLFLYNNYTFTAWVEYNASTRLIQVSMINATSPTPCLGSPLDTRLLALRSFYNLSTLFRNRTMYIGFSATNNASEDGMQGVGLFSWSFCNEGENGRDTSNDVLKLLCEVLLPLFLGCLFCIAGLYVYRKWRTNSRTSPQRDGLPQTDEELTSSRGKVAQQFSLIELRKATQAFNEANKIAEGAFGIVYRGTLHDGSLVAVKKLKQGVRKEQEFEAEMHVIHKCRHRNLLQLRGWCYEKGEAMLVYDFMEKGSLDWYIYGKDKVSMEVLDSEVRLNILRDVARALEYLHFHSPTRIVHRDVKAANVILTNKFHAMLADFGLSRLVPDPDEKEVIVINEAAGTLGSLAPEVFNGIVSDKSDVYSYGVLALEVAYGRKMIDKSLEKDRYLLDWVWALKEQGSLLEELHSEVRASMHTNHADQWKKVLHIALLCSDPAPEARPSMKQVCQVLEESSEGSLRLLQEPLPLTKPPRPDAVQFILSSYSSARL